MSWGWTALGLSILLGTIGQLALKIGLTWPARGSRAMAIMLTRPMLCWVACYAATMVFWLLALQHIPLSQAFPILGLQYALIPLLSSHLLHERLAPLQRVGVALIVLGVALVGRS